VCHGPVTALCFPFSPFLKLFIHLFHSYFIIAYWVNSICEGFFLADWSLDAEKTTFGPMILDFDESWWI
jgi:hypothetical protein